MSAPVRADRALWLAAPLGAFFALFVFLPLAGLAVVSLHADPALSAPSLRQYARFFGDPFNWGVLGDTLALAARSTALALVLGYPLAWCYVRAPRRWQRPLMLLIVLPLLTSAVVRTFAWIVILGRQGLVNEWLLAAGWIEAPARLLYTPAAVTLAIAQIELPLMVLPLITALARLDPSLAHASVMLGAGRWRTFVRVVLPLSVPGLLAGCLLVFAASASAFVTQTLVGGGRQLFMPFYLYQQAIQANDYPFAAAIAMTLLASVLAIVSVINLVMRRSRGFVHG